MKNCDTQYMISNHVYVKQEKNYETRKLNQHNAVYVSSSVRPTTE